MRIVARRRVLAGRLASMALEMILKDSLTVGWRLSTRVRYAITAAALALCIGCGSTGEVEDEREYPQIVASSFGDMRNVSVSGSIWFGTAPSVSDLELASRRGITRVIDLSAPTEKSKCDVGPVCGSLQIEYFMAAMNPKDLTSDHCVDLVLDWLSEETGEPTLMFCGSGSRCATYLAIYRSTVLNVPLEDALVEARRAGMKPGAPEDFVRAQYERLTGSEGTLTAAQR